MTKKDILETAYKDFAKVAIPTGAHPHQARDVKAAFYAGALIAYQTAMDAADLPMNDAVATLASLNDELKAFSESMRAAAAVEEAELQREASTKPQH